VLSECSQVINVNVITTVTIIIVTIDIKNKLNVVYTNAARTHDT